MCVLPSPESPYIYRAGQPVALALDEGREREPRIQLRVDDYLLESRNYEGILYICGIGLRVETRDGRGVGIGGNGYGRGCRTRHGIVQPGLLSVELRDDRAQERDVVLFDLVYVALVGNTQAQVGAVEFERYDRLEPLHELLFGRSGLDLVQTSLPFFAICLCGS